MSAMLSTTLFTGFIIVSDVSIEDN